MGQLVERGHVSRLSDAVVRQFPAFFAILVPVEQVLGELEIER